MAIEVPSSLAGRQPSSPPNGHTNGHHGSNGHGAGNGNNPASSERCSSYDHDDKNDDVVAVAYRHNHNEHRYYHRRLLSRINELLPLRLLPPSCLPIIGVFVFYIAHDALQERMFRFPGFEYGFFMTLVEVLVMLVGSVTTEGGDEEGMLSSFFYGRSGGSGRSKGKMTRQRRSLSPSVLIRIGWVGLFLALAHGLGNTSLNYSPYPLKVAFKSCKLVPTMALGACVTGRKHTALQYAAALVMGMGLAALTAADVFSSKQKVPRGHDTEWSKEMGPLIGPILLTISTVFDSVVPNLQEQLLRGPAKVRTSEMILVSNAVMCVVLVGYTLYSGELIEAWTYCEANPYASTVLFVQGLSAYLGLRCYLAMIRDHGGVVGVLLANARKVVTIVLSFVLFAKPFNERHFVGLVLVFAGVGLGYMSKKEKTKGGGSRNEFPSKKDGGKRGPSPPGGGSGRRKRVERRKSGGGGDDDDVNADEEFRDHKV